MMNKIIDLFCGCGGLSLGFEMAGFESAYAIDMWEDAVKTYNHNHASHIAECKDIHELTNEHLDSLGKSGEYVGVVGGPPCQGFSTVGRRIVEDPRNSLYLEYCRVVEHVKPEFFVLENVRGLTTLAGGAFRDDIVNRFSSLGYRVKYEILNAADYGVPQNRFRVFFVGLKRKEFVFPKRHDVVLSCKDGISDLPSIDDSKAAISEFEYDKPAQNSFQRAMRGNCSGVANHQITVHSEQTKAIIGMIPNGGGIKDLPKEYWSVRKYNKAFERMDCNKPSNTVDTGHRNYFHFSENRIPTARENARLQSFPDSFIFLGNKTSQYKQIGNAVPPLLAFEVARAIKEQI